MSEAEARPAVHGQDSDSPGVTGEVCVLCRSEEIVMPDEQIGLVKENYVWSVLLHRGATPEGLFLHLPPGSCDHDLFSMTWGPTIAALSYVFDKSLDDGILQKAIAGFRYQPSIPAEEPVSRCSTSPCCSGLSLFSGSVQ